MSATTWAMDDYISTFPPGVRVHLESIRQAIRRAAPDAEEVISYGIPTFTLAGRYLVYFAGWKHHISLYPIPDDTLVEELVPYRSGKGTLRFPLSEPMPLGLVQRVAEALVRRRLGETP